MTAAVVDLDAHRPHLVVQERCRECGHSCIGTIPEEAPRDALECGGCGRMTSAVTHYERDGELHPRLENV